MKKTKPEYYPPVENLLDLIYEHYTENNPVEKNTVAGKAAKTKEKELEEWLRGRKRTIASTFFHPLSSAIIVSHYTQSKKFSTDLF